MVAILVPHHSLAIGQSTAAFVQSHNLNPALLYTPQHHFGSQTAPSSQPVQMASSLPRPRRIVASNLPIQSSGAETFSEPAVEILDETIAPTPILGGVVERATISTHASVPTSNDGSYVSHEWTRTSFQAEADHGLVDLSHWMRSLGQVSSCLGASTSTFLIWRRTA
jgi:hypothetical protein